MFLPLIPVKRTLWEVIHVSVGSIDYFLYQNYFQFDSSTPYVPSTKGTRAERITPDHQLILVIHQDFLFVKLLENYINQICHKVTSKITVCSLSRQSS